ncbi:MAG: hypothetical protein EHM87_18705, partial [Burkholderiales bacterium]
GRDVDHKALEAHKGHEAHEEHGGHGARDGHAAHADHTGHEDMFRRRFWVSLLLSIHLPFRQRLLEVVAVASALAVVLLAQSQTVWLGTLIAVPLLLLGRSEFRPLDRRPVLFTLSGLAVMVGAALIAAVFFSPDLSVESLATGSRYRELTTLTGRVAIWDVAIAEWRDNLLFGYGPSAWDKDFRARIGMQFAFTAHNQFLQSLSTAGLVGLLTTVGYVATLGWLSVTAPRAERGLALALLSILMSRILTETPLHIATPFSNEFLPHFLLFSLLAFAHTRERTVPLRAAGTNGRLRGGPPGRRGARRAETESATPTGVIAR